VNRNSYYPPHPDPLLKEERETGVHLSSQGQSISSSLLSLYREVIFLLSSPFAGRLSSFSPLPLQGRLSSFSPLPLQGGYLLLSSPFAGRLSSFSPLPLQGRGLR